MDNIKNGYDFLAKNEFDSAINAFSNAINADAKDIEAHFGLSQAYYFLYKETTINSYKNTAKDHANICINLNPKHPQSYAAKSFLSLINDDDFNISSENTTKNLVEEHAQTTYDKHLQEENLRINSEKYFEKNVRENDKKEANNSVGTTTFGFGCVGSFLVLGAIVFYINKVSNTNDKEKIRTEMIKNTELPLKTMQDFAGATLNEDGILVWKIHYQKIDTYLERINIGKNMPSQERYLMSHTNNIFEYNNVIYALGGANFESFEIRDMKTGGAWLNTELLGRKFPELGAEIGKVKPFQGKGVEIITRKGDQFYYLFVNQKLYSATERKELESDSEGNLKNKNGYVEQYLWYTKDKETVKKTYFMAKTLENPFLIDIKATKNILPTAENLIQANEGKNNNEFQKFPTTTKTFLEGNLVYGDKDYAIIAHKNAIGEYQHLYTCIEAQTGKILWEKIPEKNLVFNNENANANNWELNKTSRNGDLVLFYNNKPTPNIVVINIITGEITLEKQNIF